MEFLLLLISLLLVYLIVCVALICFSDGDLCLMWCDKFGSKLRTLRGKVIWITGASSGIGAATAIEAAKYGAKIVLSARSKGLLEDVKKKCLEAGREFSLTSKDVLVLPMDVTKFDIHQPCLQKVLKQFGQLDIMFHNAGRSQRAIWDEIDLAVDKELFDLNVFAAVNLTRTVLPHFDSRGSGCLAVVSSVAGKFGVPMSGTYTGSKHALHGYFESLRTEKMNTGIDITMLCPGPTFSNLLQVAATAKPGQTFQSQMTSSDKRMTAERCAHLSLVALTHKLEESWIALFPVLGLLYFGQYMPTLCKRIMRRFGLSVFQKLRDSRETVKER